MAPTDDKKTTGEKLEAIQQELHDLSREYRRTPVAVPTVADTPQPLDRRIDERADAKVKEHRFQCAEERWGDDGTFGKFREEVRRDLSVIKSWSKAIAITMGILALLNAWSTWTRSSAPPPAVVPAAHADTPVSK